ncbi:hypothetical protein [Dasania marina]|uniref:GFA family protein n=1 Tax=Dasania marina TaxID=471499 RepID=UPI0004B6528C|nr:hypothetical protein [Dasania marina]
MNKKTDHSTITITGSCNCHNISYIWHKPDDTIIPRACQCHYCLSKGAAYATQTNTRLTVSINNSALHSVVQHGSNSAHFHECSYCDQVVFVTAEIAGRLYGAVNAMLITQKAYLAQPVKLDFSAQTPQQKQQRWQQSWCSPVEITGLG